MAALGQSVPVRSRDPNVGFGNAFLPFTVRGGNGRESPKAAVLSSRTDGAGSRQQRTFGPRDGALVRLWVKVRNGADAGQRLDCSKQRQSLKPVE